MNVIELRMHRATARTEMKRSGIEVARHKRCGAQ